MNTRIREKLCLERCGVSYCNDMKNVCNWVVSQEKYLKGFIDIIRQDIESSYCVGCLKLVGIKSPEPKNFRNCAIYGSLPNNLDCSMAHCPCDFWKLKQVED